MKYIIVKVQRNSQQLEDQAMSVFTNIMENYPTPSSLLEENTHGCLLTVINEEESKSSHDPIPYKKDKILFVLEVAPDSDRFVKCILPSPKKQKQIVDLASCPDSFKIEQRMSLDQLPPFEKAKWAIYSLRQQLREEVSNHFFIRLFTDIRGTKAIKLAALNNLIKGFKNDSITNMAQLASKAQELIKKDSRITYTSSLLTSRTATLLNKIIEDSPATMTDVSEKGEENNAAPTSRNRLLK